MISNKNHAEVELEMVQPPVLGKEIKLDVLSDSFGREFSYLRLSVTEKCNFKCVYCLPNGYQCSKDKNPQIELSVNEMKNLVSAFTQLGVRKVRLTGGEPTLRRDLLQIIETIASIDGIKKIALTTNGYRLKSIAQKLKQSGLNAINISLDSLDANRFFQMTGTHSFFDVYEGIENCLSLGFDDVKINVVLMRDYNLSDLIQFMEWVKNKPVSVRFIELMRTGDNKELFEKQHVSGKIVYECLLKNNWTENERAVDGGPAREFSHPDYLGNIGIIAPYSKNFCTSCNRLRVGSMGQLKLCLFGEGEISLRNFLKSDSQVYELVSLIKESLGEKSESHYLYDGLYGSTKNLSMIGG